MRETSEAVGGLSKGKWGIVGVDMIIFWLLHAENCSLFLFVFPLPPVLPSQGGGTPLNTSTDCSYKHAQCLEEQMGVVREHPD